MPRVFLDLCNGLSSSTLFLTEWKSFWAQKREKTWAQKNYSLSSSSARPLSFKRETHESSLFSYQRFTLTIFWINFTYLGQTFILCRRRLVREKKVLLQIHCRFGCGTLPINSTIDKHSSKKSTSF